MIRQRSASSDYRSALKNALSPSPQVVAGCGLATEARMLPTNTASTTCGCNMVEVTRTTDIHLPTASCMNICAAPLLTAFSLIICVVTGCASTPNMWKPSLALKTDVAASGSPVNSHAEPIAREATPTPRPIRDSGKGIAAVGNASDNLGESEGVVVDFLGSMGGAEEQGETVDFL